MEEDNANQRLQFKVINTTTYDPQFPPYTLEQFSLQSKGW